ncbi:hypothetical protein Tco_1013253 [Tanacetum coccineum]
MLYPRYTKLIINHVFGTYPVVPKHFLESYHYVYNNDPVAKMFATGEKVPKVVGLLAKLLTDDIKRTVAYQDYVDYQPNPSPRLEPWSNKENMKEFVDDDDDDDDDDDEMIDSDDHIDLTLIRKERTGSSETRNEKMQTPIHTPLDLLGVTYLRIRKHL